MKCYMHRKVLKDNNTLHGRCFCLGKQWSIVLYMIWDIKVIIMFGVIVGIIQTSLKGVSIRYVFLRIEWRLSLHHQFNTYFLTSLITFRFWLNLKINETGLARSGNNCFVLKRCGRN